MLAANEYQASTTGETYASVRIGGVGLITSRALGQSNCGMSATKSTFAARFTDGIIHVYMDPIEQIWAPSQSSFRDATSLMAVTFFCRGFIKDVH